MDFDTGRRLEGSQGGSREPPRSSGGAPPRPASGGGGGDFNLSDPINSFVGTVRSILLSPRRFFQFIARRGDFAGPLVFALICAVISGIMSGIVGTASILISGDLSGALLEFLGSALLSPVLALVGLLVGAGIWHLLVLLLVGPGNAGFEATFRVAAYVSAIRLLTWVVSIPRPSMLVFWVTTGIFLVVGFYGLYIAYFGIRELHSTTDQRAAAVVALPVLVGIVLAILFGVVIAAMFPLGP